MAHSRNGLPSFRDQEELDYYCNLNPTTCHVDLHETVFQWLYRMQYLPRGMLRARAIDIMDASCGRLTLILETRDGQPDNARVHRWINGENVRPEELAYHLSRWEKGSSEEEQSFQSSCQACARLSETFGSDGSD
ncbi:hypothetical protein LTR62_004220 [Meristemomyces frigidus]|uniref:Uncharacterized protein n=1 Tax=Meristemomyces frigidus TaxID=1508187 RepID=A0AAN7TFP7_9PEZI|nr:hypothetical protein LTR62_004220 [Meristemomyces frigidus]